MGIKVDVHPEVFTYINADVLEAVSEDIRLHISADIQEDVGETAPRRL